MRRIFWFIILTGCCVGAASVLRSSLSLYGSGSVAYSVDTGYIHWDTAFPAVTVCEQIDVNRIKTYLQKNDLSSSLATFYKEVSFWNIKYCKTCLSCAFNSTCVRNYQEGIVQIRLNCTDILTDCWWDEKHFRCCDRFRPVHTEYGVCFVFNSALNGNETDVLKLNRRVGTPRLVLSAVEIINIRIHASDETVSVALDNILGRSSILPLMATLEVILKAEQTVNDVSVTSISQGFRGCLFKNEQPTFVEKWPFNSYTYSACLLNCRAMIQYSLCNCTYHFMSKIVQMPACDVEDEISKYTCDCPMGCDEITYKPTHIFYNRSSKQGDSPVRASKVVVRLSQLPTMRVRRFAIRDNLGLVVDIGGVGGVFFGASLLSLIEFVYLFCIRRK
ncbi:sodium channel protein Nach-like [Leptidea sinapis]|uniref:sodium channel protein Nach-like n=1 Tax=Leptidea sinapis TaxID=189913 RepID=UPI0021C28986|nr:sodium channel protein Nach-like [Leptidea sinapis]